MFENKGHYQRVWLYILEVGGGYSYEKVGVRHWKQSDSFMLFKAAEFSAARNSMPSLSVLPECVCLCCLAGGGGGRGGGEGVMFSKNEMSV